MISSRLESRARGLNSATTFTPATISITGKGRLTVGQDLEAVLRKVEYWHQAPIITFSIMARHGRGAWHGVQWDGKTATSFPLNETDEKKAMQGQFHAAHVLRNDFPLTFLASCRCHFRCKVQHDLPTGWDLGSARHSGSEQEGVIPFCPCIDTARERIGSIKARF